jgi:hypothetical protein
MGVLVVGMHRSGTSALTGALEAAGLFLGPPSAVAPTERDNSEGYFELYPIAQLNEEILIHLGGAWDRPPVFRAGWSAEPEIEVFVQRASDMVTSLFEGRKFVVKDPRMTLLLPLWRRALLDHCCAILIIRDPVAVAWSLALRNGMSTLTSLALWSKYYRSAIEGLSGLPVHVCSYEDLVETPGPVLTEIAASLRDWGELGEEIDIDAAIQRIKPVLRRDTWPQGRPELTDIPREVVELKKRIAEGLGRHDSCEFGKIPEPARWEPALLEERRIAGVQVRATVVERARVQTLNVDLQALNVDLQQRWENAEQECNRTHVLLADLEQRLVESGIELARVQSHNAELERQCERVEVESAELQQRCKMADADLSRYEAIWTRLERFLPSRIYHAIRDRVGV